MSVELWLGRAALSRALHSLDQAEPAWILVEVACTLVSMQCFARALRCMVRGVAPDAARPRLSLLRMMRLTYSANALSTTMPAGGPVSILFMHRQFRAWGVSHAAAGFALVASGLLSTLTFAGLIVACGLATGRADAAVAVGSTLVLALLIGAAVRRRFAIGVPQLIASLVGRLGRLLARVSTTGVDADAVGIELESVRLRRRDWLGAGGFAAGNWLADLVSLTMACRAVPGLPPVGIVAVLSAYLAGMSASSIAVLPGGFGVVEVAMIATLHTSGLPMSGATAAVLLYRLVSCAFVVAVGWLSLSIAGLAIVRSRRAEPAEG